MVYCVVLDSLLGTSGLFQILELSNSSSLKSFEFYFEPEYTREFIK